MVRRNRRHHGLSCMTKQQAELIIGSEVMIEEFPQRRFRASCVDCFGVTLAEDGYSVVVACRRLVAMNYASSRRFVLERDGYRCVNCGAYGAMQCDHKQMRSHGRDDRPENLIALCDGCHKIRHKRGRNFYGHRKT